jgi:hypothetical protein
MRRSSVTPTIAAALCAAAIIASCSGDGSSSDPIAPTIDGVNAQGESLSGGGWTPEVATVAARNDKVAICHSGNGKNFTRIEVSAQGARAHLGDPETGKGGHEDDFRISELTPCPPPSEPGHVRLCKVAEAGVAVGTKFTFTLVSDNRTKELTIAAGATPTGNCIDASEFRVGRLIEVREALRTDVHTAAIIVSPAGALQGTKDLDHGLARIIAGAGTTTLTFVNRGPTGTLVICKIGGAGISTGTKFDFTAGGYTKTVEAGPGPEGRCASELHLSPGEVTVTEAAVAGTSVKAIAGSPTAKSVSLTGRSASILITRDKESRITFTNTKP